MALQTFVPLTGPIPLGREDWVIQTFRVTMQARSQDGAAYFRTGLDKIQTVLGHTIKANSTRASVVMTFTGAATAGGTVTVNGRVYTSAANPTATLDAFDVETTAAAQATSLVYTINASGTASTDYGPGQLANADVFATSVAGVITLTAIEPGEHGNRLTIAETCDNFTIAASASTLAGGAGNCLTRQRGVLTYSDANVNAETTTVDGIVYTHETTPSVNYGIDVQAAEQDVAKYFERAINGTYAVGEVFAGTPAHPTCTAIATLLGVLTVYKKNAGGEALVVAEGDTNGAWASAAALELQIGGSGNPTQIECFPNRRTADGSDGDNDGDVAILCSDAATVLDITVLGTTSSRL